MAAEFRSLRVQEYHQMILPTGKRADLRTFDECRPLEIVLSPLSTADGSSSIRFGNTNILTGIHGIVVPPAPNAPDKGILEVTARLPPNALHEFKWNRDAASDQETLLTARLTKILVNSGSIDLKQLVIDPEHVWKLEIELICLDFDGNIVDVAMAGLVSSLMTTKLPGVAVKPSSKMLDFSAEKKPLLMSSYPFTLTFALLKEVAILCDPTAEEELICDGLVSITTDGDGKIYGLHKDGDAIMDDDGLLQLADKTIDRSRYLHHQISQKLRLS